MSTNPIFLTELILCEGGAVAFAAWELWKIRPAKKKDADKAEAQSAFACAAPKSGSPEPPGHAEGEHRPDDG
jgi:hypothetical protein